MSDENGKVCCNCRHNIRHWDKEQCTCRCDLDNHYIGYVECMTGWCGRWAKDKKQKGDRMNMEWISIDKNVPTNGQRVLVCFNDGFILIGAYINYAEDGKEPYWAFDGEEDFNLEDAQVIAWMPLPPSYQGEENG